MLPDRMERRELRRLRARVFRAVVHAVPLRAGRDVQRHHHWRRLVLVRERLGWGVMRPMLSRPLGSNVRRVQLRGRLDVRHRAERHRMQLPTKLFRAELRLVHLRWQCALRRWD